MPAASACQDVARRLMDDGYVVVTGMLTPPGAQAARADLDRVLRTTRTGRNSFEGFDTQRIYALFAKTRAFDALATEPLLLGVLDQGLGHYQLLLARHGRVRPPLELRLPPRADRDDGDLGQPPLDRCAEAQRRAERGQPAAGAGRRPVLFLLRAYVRTGQTGAHRPMRSLATWRHTWQPACLTGMPKLWAYTSSRGTTVASTS